MSPTTVFSGSCHMSLLVIVSDGPSMKGHMSLLVIHLTKLTD